MVLVSGACAAAAFALPASSSAFVTVGSNLNDSSDTSFSTCTLDNCTLLQNSLPAASTAPGGLTAPVAGRVITWRVKTGCSEAACGPGGFASDPVGIQLRVLSSAGGQSTGLAGTSQSVLSTSALPFVQEISTNIPIAVGNGIGLNLLPNAGFDPSFSSLFITTSNVGEYAEFDPALAESGSAAPAVTATEEVLFNATIDEPPTISLAVQNISAPTKKKKKAKKKSRASADCANQAVDVTVTVNDDGATMASGSLSADGKAVASSALKQYTTRISVAGLAAGSHPLTATTTDTAGQSANTAGSFNVCKAAAKKKKHKKKRREPGFTG